MRYSMVLGAALLLGAALFVAVRGPSRNEEQAEDALDGLDADVLRAELSLEPAGV